jgi:hypothetical protein
VTTLGGMLAHLIRCLTVSYVYSIAYRMTTQYIVVCVIKWRRSVFAAAPRTLADPGVGVRTRLGHVTVTVTLAPLSAHGRLSLSRAGPSHARQSTDYTDGMGPFGLVPGPGK